MFQRETGVGDSLQTLSYPTVTGTSDIVSLPKMSITFTAITWRPGFAYLCGADFSSRSLSCRVRKLCHSFSKM